MSDESEDVELPIEICDPKFFSNAVCQYFCSGGYQSPFVATLIAKKYRDVEGMSIDLETVVATNHAEGDGLVDHDHTLLDQLKYKQAMAMRGDHSYSFARESEYKLARMPMEIDRDLEQRSTMGLILYGIVDIYNTSFIFICETFDYLVDVSTEIDQYATTEKVECHIDYDSIKTYRYSIKIDEFVKRFYMNSGPLNLQEIISRLGAMIGHGDEA